MIEGKTVDGEAAEEQVVEDANNCGNNCGGFFDPRPFTLDPRLVTLDSRVEGRGRGYHVEGRGSRVTFFFPNFYFLEKVIIDAINVIKTNKKNLKNKWRVNIF